VKIAKEQLIQIIKEELSKVDNKETDLTYGISSKEDNEEESDMKADVNRVLDMMQKKVFKYLEKVNTRTEKEELLGAILDYLKVPPHIMSKSVKQNIKKQKKQKTEK